MSTAGSHDFYYDEEQRLIRIEKYNHTQIDIEYNAAGQIIVVYQSHSTNDLVLELTVSYLEGADLPDAISYAFATDKGDGTFDIIRFKRTFFQWDENGNLTYWLQEVDEQDGNGFVFDYDYVASYDDKQNPWYSTINDKFLFNQFFVYSLNTTLETFHFNTLIYWISKNNITHGTVRNIHVFSGRESTYGYSYTYNEEGYPIAAILEVMEASSNLRTLEFNWKY